MATMYVNYGSFETWAQKISEKNQQLLEYLNDISKEINSLESSYISNSADTTRQKINGMRSRFQNYYDVVDAYAKFVKNTGAAYRAIEEVTDNRAKQFI